MALKMKITVYVDSGVGQKFKKKCDQEGNSYSVRVERLMQWDLLEAPDGWWETLKKKICILPMIFAICV